MKKNKKKYSRVHISPKNKEILKNIKQTKSIPIEFIVNDILAIYLNEYLEEFTITKKA